MPICFCRTRIFVFFREPSQNERVACRDPALPGSFPNLLLKCSETTACFSEILVLDVGDSLPVLPTSGAEFERPEAFPAVALICSGEIVVLRSLRDHRTALPATLILPHDALFLSVEVGVSVLAIAPHLAPPYVYTDFIIKLGSTESTIAFNAKFLHYKVDHKGPS